MKKISQIAKECNVDWRTVYEIVRKENIVRCDSLINKYQEDLIHQILYFEGKITEITLESKINYE